jgi:hypothetical protein
VFVQRIPYERPPYFYETTPELEALFFEMNPPDYYAPLIVEPVYEFVPYLP